MTNQVDAKNHGDGRRSGGGRRDETPTVDIMLRALLSPRRRRILYQLKARSGWVSVDALVDQLSAAERSAEAERDSRRFHTSIASTLYHDHLPRLVEYGIIDFDTDANEIRYVPAPMLDEWLDFVSTFE